MTFGSSGTGTGMDNSIPEVREREGNGKNPFPKFGNGKGMKKTIPENREGNQRPPFLGMTGNGNSRSPLHQQTSASQLKLKFKNGKGIKKSIPKLREREGNEKKPSQNSGMERE